MSPSNPQDNFARLGLSPEDVAKMSPLEKMTATAALSNMSRSDMYEDPNRLRELMGVYGEFRQKEAKEAARIGPCSIYYDDVHDVFAHAQKTDTRYMLAGLQLLIKHFDKKDQLVVRISPSHPGLSIQEWQQTLLKARPMLQEEADRGNVHLPLIEIVAQPELEKNPRTGKLKRVIDLRLN
jgi:hypothetical protein